MYRRWAGRAVVCLVLGVCGGAVEALKDLHGLLLDYEEEEGDPDDPAREDLPGDELPPVIRLVANGGFTVPVQP